MIIEAVRSSETLVNTQAYTVQHPMRELSSPSLLNLKMWITLVCKINWLIYVLLKDAVNILDCVLSIDRVIKDQWIAKDMEVSGHGLI